MCVCMHACMYACMHGCMYACMYVCMHACMYVCLFAMARSQLIKLAGFPDFEGVTKMLQNTKGTDQPEYKTCAALADGTLVVSVALREMWTKKAPRLCPAVLPARRCPRCRVQPAKAGSAHVRGAGCGCQRG